MLAEQAQRWFVDVARRDQGIAQTSRLSPATAVQCVLVEDQRLGVGVGYRAAIVTSGELGAGPGDAWGVTSGELGAGPGDAWGGGAGGGQVSGIFLAP